MKGLVIILLVSLVIGSVIYFGNRVLNPMPRVIVRVNPEYRETSYYVIDEHGKISLTTYQTKLNKGSLRLRSNSDAPIAVQAKYVSLILGRVLKDEDKAGLSTLFIGRLINAFGNDHTMSERLALGAAGSYLWDAKNGRPISGHANPATKKIANGAEIYNELRQAFNEHGLDITVSGMEKVLIDKRSGGLVPIDAMTWFRITQK
jgi:hypothetical protein